METLETSLDPPLKIVLLKDLSINPEDVARNYNGGGRYRGGRGGVPPPPPPHFFPSSMRDGWQVCWLAIAWLTNYAKSKPCMDKEFSYASQGQLWSVGCWEVC